MSTPSTCCISFFYLPSSAAVSSVPVTTVKPISCCSCRLQIQFYFIYVLHTVCQAIDQFIIQLESYREYFMTFDRRSLVAFCYLFLLKNPTCTHFVFFPVRSLLNSNQMKAGFELHEHAELYLNIFLRVFVQNYLIVFKKSLLFSINLSSVCLSSAITHRIGRSTLFRPPDPCVLLHLTCCTHCWTAITFALPCPRATISCQTHYLVAFV